MNTLPASDLPGNPSLATFGLPRTPEGFSLWEGSARYFAGMLPPPEMLAAARVVALVGLPGTGKSHAAIQALKDSNVLAVTPLNRVVHSICGRADAAGATAATHQHAEADITAASFMCTTPNSLQRARELRSSDPYVCLLDEVESGLRSITTGNHIPSNARPGMLDAYLDAARGSSQAWLADADLTPATIALVADACGADRQDVLVVRNNYVPPRGALNFASGYHAAADEIFARLKKDERLCVVGSAQKRVAGLHADALSQGYVSHLIDRDTPPDLANEWLTNPSAQQVLWLSPAVLAGVSIDEVDGMAAYDHVYGLFTHTDIGVDGAFQMLYRVRGSVPTTVWWGGSGAEETIETARVLTPDEIFKVNRGKRRKATARALRLPGADMEAILRRDQDFDLVGKIASRYAYEARIARVRTGPWDFAAAARERGHVTVEDPPERTRASGPQKGRERRRRRAARARDASHSLSLVRLGQGPGEAPTPQLKALDKATQRRIQRTQAYLDEGLVVPSEDGVNSAADVNRLAWLEHENGKARLNLLLALVDRERAVAADKRELGYATDTTATGEGALWAIEVDLRHNPKAQWGPDDRDDHTLKTDAIRGALEAAMPGLLARLATPDPDPDMTVTYTSDALAGFYRWLRDNEDKREWVIGREDLPATKGDVTRAFNDLLRKQLPFSVTNRSRGAKEMKEAAEAAGAGAEVPTRKNTLRWDPVAAGTWRDWQTYWSEFGADEPLSARRWAKLRGLPWPRQPAPDATVEIDDPHECPWARGDTDAPRAGGSVVWWRRARPSDDLIRRTASSSKAAVAKLRPVPEPSKPMRADAPTVEEALAEPRTPVLSDPLDRDAFSSIESGQRVTDLATAALADAVTDDPQNPRKGGLVYRVRDADMLARFKTGDALPAPKGWTVRHGRRSERGALASQQFPKVLRGYFGAGPGRVMLAVDMVASDMNILAQRFGEPWLAALATAPGAYMSLAYLLEGALRDGVTAAQQRKALKKSANAVIKGGAGIPGVSAIFEPILRPDALSATALRFVQAVWRQIPRVADTWWRIHGKLKEARAQGYRTVRVRSCAALEPITVEADHPGTVISAIATSIEGAIADGALRRAAADLAELDCRISVHAHDGAFWSCPEENAEAALVILRQAWVDAAADIGFCVDVTAEIQRVWGGKAPPPPRSSVRISRFAGDDPQTPAPAPATPTAPAPATPTGPGGVPREKSA